MADALKIALVGDHDETLTAHRAIPLALALAARQAGIEILPTWLATDQVGDGQALAPFDGLWCVPGSPYRSMDGALTAIRFARESGLPFLGSCGGFQHAIVEYARNAMGWDDAEHAETAPKASRPVISLLACALVETQETLRPVAGTRLARAYGAEPVTEAYRCRYGLNPALAARLVGEPPGGAVRGQLCVAAANAAGEARAVELRGHPFFVATLFQPERLALAGRLPPLVRAFIDAAAAQRAARHAAPGAAGQEVA